MVVTYLTNNEWAVRKNKASMAAYLQSNANAFPSNTMLNALRDDAFALINEKIGESVDITSRLLKLEYDIVEIFLDTEVARTTRPEAIIELMNNYFIPEVEDDMDALDDDFNRGATPN